MASDEELMSAVAGGDLNAFEELVRRHERGAVNVAFRMLFDEHRAQDVAQEAFLRVFQSAPKYKPTAKFRTYLYRVLTRICIDHYRKRSASPSDELDSMPDKTDSPSDVFMRNEQVERVRRALDSLPLRQRTALVLQHYEGLSYHEVAEALGCSVRAVDSLLIRAKCSLKKELEGMV